MHMQRLCSSIEIWLLSNESCNKFASTSVVMIGRVSSMVSALTMSESLPKFKCQSAQGKQNSFAATAGRAEEDNRCLGRGGQCLARSNGGQLRPASTSPPQAESASPSTIQSVIMIIMLSRGFGPSEARILGSLKYHHPSHSFQHTKERKQ